MLRSRRAVENLPGTELPRDPPPVFPSLVCVYASSGCCDAIAGAIHLRVFIVYVISHGMPWRVEGIWPRVAQTGNPAKRLTVASATWVSAS